MGKKKVKRRSKTHALSPINKNGLKVGTLLMEAGIGLGAWDAYQNIKAGNHQEGAAAFSRVFTDPAGLKGSLFYTGLGISLLGKLTGMRRFGPIQLS